MEPNDKQIDAALDEIANQIMNRVKPEDVEHGYTRSASSYTVTEEIIDGADDDCDMEIHVAINGKPKNGSEYVIRDTIYNEGVLPLTINGANIEIPWRLKIILLE